MCTEYMIGGKIISNQADLAKILGTEKLPFRPEDDFGEVMTDKYNPTDCLCPVSPEEVGRILGLRVVGSSMYYHFGEDEIKLAEEEEKRFGFDKSWLREIYNPAK